MMEYSIPAAPGGPFNLRTSFFFLISNFLLIDKLSRGVIKFNVNACLKATAAQTLPSGARGYMLCA